MSKVKRSKRVKDGRSASRNGERDLWAHGYGRAALERMTRIHRKIEDREYPNCRKMSGEFEISVRTLKRDIEFMKNSLALPIEFDVPKNGYYFATPQPHFPRVPQTERRLSGCSWRRSRLHSIRGRRCSQCWRVRFGRWRHSWMIASGIHWGIWRK